MINKYFQKSVNTLGKKVIRYINDNLSDFFSSDYSGDSGKEQFFF